MRIPATRNYLGQTEGHINVFPEAHLVRAARRVVNVLCQNLQHKSRKRITMVLYCCRTRLGVYTLRATLSRMAPAPPLLKTFCFGGKKRRPMYRPFPAAASAWISAEPAWTPIR